MLTITITCKILITCNCNCNDYIYQKYSNYNYFSITFNYNYILPFSITFLLQVMNFYPDYQEKFTKKMAEFTDLNL